MYKVDILSSNDIYKADTNVLLFRANEGSAMTVFAGNNGRYIHHHIVHQPITSPIITYLIEEGITICSYLYKFCYDFGS